jgi:hypothetical protein
MNTDSRGDATSTEMESLPRAGTAAAQNADSNVKKDMRSNSMTGLPRIVEDENTRTDVVVETSLEERPWRRGYYACLALLLVNGWIGIMGGFIELSAVNDTGVSIFYISMAGLLLGGAFSDFGVVMAHIGMYGVRIPHLTLFWIAQAIAMCCHIGFTSAMTAFYTQFQMDPETGGKEYWDKALPSSITGFQDRNKCVGWDGCQSAYIAALDKHFTTSMALGWTQAAIMLVIGPILWWIVTNLTRVIRQVMYEEEVEAKMNARRRAEQGNTH